MPTTSSEPKQQRGLVKVLPLAVRHWRMDHKGWSQEILADRATRTEHARAAGVKVSPSMIAMIERKKRQPSIHVARALAEALGVPVGAFAFVNDDDDHEDLVA